MDARILHSCEHGKKITGMQILPWMWGGHGHHIAPPLHLGFSWGPLVVDIPQFAKHRFRLIYNGGHQVRLSSLKLMMMMKKKKM